MSTPIEIDTSQHSSLVVAIAVPPREGVAVAKPVTTSTETTAKPEMTLKNPREQLHHLDEMRRSLSEAISQVNEQLRRQDQNLNFSIDKASGRTVITVKNTQSGEIVRQIPDEAVLRVGHNLEQLKGLLFNQLI